MNKTIKCRSYAAATIISNTFIEQYMAKANGSYIKVYVYLAMCIQSCNEDISLSMLADKMEITESDVVRALQYWAKNGLITLTRDDITGDIIALDMCEPAVSESAASVSPSQPAYYNEAENTYSDIFSNRKAEYTSTAAPADAITIEKSEPSSSVRTDREIVITAEQAERLAADQSFGWVCSVVESYLQHPLKSAELQLLSYLFDNLGFSTELLLYLYEYCVSLGKTSTSYIQAVAFAWHEKGVTTPEEAKQQSMDYNYIYTSISKALVLGRPLASVEKQFVDRWHESWKFDLGVILEACNRTLLKLQKADFKYTDGILDNWNKAGIHTLTDIEKADTAFRQKKAERAAGRQAVTHNNAPKPNNQFNSFQQRQATQSEVDDLEKKLLLHR